MIACLVIPAFPLRAALRSRSELVGRPAALAPRPGEGAAVGPCSAVAERAGVRPGMHLGEALATCPGLVLVEQDPAAVEAEWERILHRLEGAGLAVEPAGPGCVYFETRGIERLAGGLDAALRRALEAAGASWGRGSAPPRDGLPPSQLPAWRPPDAPSSSTTGRRRSSSSPCRSICSRSPDRRRELSALGIRRLGELARLPGPSVADRLGPDGERAWRLARGEDVARISPRRPPVQLAETLAFPEPIANAYTLERALVALLERLLVHPERAGRAPRQLVLEAGLAAGGSWRHVATLREPTAEPARLRAALAPRLADLPGPAAELRLALGALVEAPGVQEELVRPRGNRLRELLRDGLRQARAAAGADAVCTVMEVAPWSRIPEARALLVPRDD